MFIGNQKIDSILKTARYRKEALNKAIELSNTDVENEEYRKEVFIRLKLYAQSMTELLGYIDNHTKKPRTRKNGKTKMGVKTVG
jgi:sulfur relay (sulfurtransferase) complex TusBCD TusD component (DsrE family)